MLYELHDQPSLEEPVLVMVLEGWIDAGYAATTAAQTLLNGIDSYPVATFDTDALLDWCMRLAGRPDGPVDR